jgi:NAD(P)-dependent dehydrogenase (short-subunit alcohol dehydrogenase family)
VGYQSIFTKDLFAGRTVVITGGGSGIGRCTAHELAALGADVAIVGRNAALCGGNTTVMERSQQFFDKVDRGRNGATATPL